METLMVDPVRAAIIADRLYDAGDPTPIRVDIDDALNGQIILHCFRAASVATMLREIADAMESTEVQQGELVQVREVTHGKEG